MDGVRRWIGSGQRTTGTRKISDKRGDMNHNELDGESPHREKQDLDPRSMEATVASLLSPTVKEEAEYQL